MSAAQRPRSALEPRPSPATEVKAHPGPVISTHRPCSWPLAAPKPRRRNYLRVWAASCHERGWWVRARKCRVFLGTRHAYGCCSARDAPLRSNICGAWAYGGAPKPGPKKRATAAATAEPRQWGDRRAPSGGRQPIRSCLQRGAAWDPRVGPHGRRSSVACKWQFAIL